MQVNTQQTRKQSLSSSILQKGQAFFKISRVGGGDLKITPLFSIKKDKWVLPSHHNRPPYVTTYVHDVVLKRV